MFCRLRFLLTTLLLVSNGVVGFISKIPVANSSGLHQDIVTWDAHSFKVYDERLFLFSGEFHPFRLPVPGLWLDVFQKIKAMGFNGVSFYTDWALLEGQRGEVITEGIWSLQPFFEAASEAGIYLIARPGPYINAETSAGGMPGWTLRLNSTLRSDAPEYLDATKLYLQTLGKIIADAQITNGGPVILVQPENEYTTWPNVNASDFPEPFNRRYMAFVEQQLRGSGVIVPLIFNDNEGSNGPTGYFAPGTGLGEVDIYGIDAYPMRYDCAHPAVWPTYRFPRYWNTWHEQVSPSNPFSIPEFQGGSGTGWGPDSVNQDMCNALVNEESVRVLFKNNYGFGVKLLNVYMTYGGTNWGNLGYQGGDTSYDYGAAITEDRHVWREKYSEQKLEANFLKVSPSFLTALPGNTSNGSYVSTGAIATTPLFGTEVSTNFYVVRHADFTSLANTTYRLSVSATHGNFTVPQLGGDLSLNGRDSKVHVTDYDIGGVNLIYCTADIFTWAQGDSGRRILVMYGGANEVHEFALPDYVGKPNVSSEPSIKMEGRGQASIIQWSVKPQRQVLTFPDVNLDVYLLWRNEAYDHWVLELPSKAPVANYSSPSKSHVIVKGGYLMRTAKVEDRTLSLTGDLNCTTELEILHEPTGSVDQIFFNGRALNGSRNEHGNLCATAKFQSPALQIPDLSSLEWKSIDSLPELSPTYDDTKWTSCNNKNTTNPLLKLQTPTSLYASDYGYHSGSLVYRGHFTATGDETSLFLNTSGGNAFAHSVFLNQTFLGSWTGNNSNQTYAQDFPFASSLSPGADYVLTVLIDHMGQDEEAPGTDAIKFPKGILSYALHGAAHTQTPITWKMTGNLGGENYLDKVRGPRNEGAMYAERQGYHLPNPPSNDWKTSSPFSEGMNGPGVAFYSTSFKLDVPRGYDVPMSFVFNNGTYGAGSSAYRVQLFVNGYQFGKYVDNLGPQTAYPVPEGILNYEGVNYVALTLWGLEEKGASIGDLQLVPQMPVQSGYFAERVPLSPQPAWKERKGAY